MKKPLAPALLTTNLVKEQDQEHLCYDSVLSDYRDIKINYQNNKETFDNIINKLDTDNCLTKIDKLQIRRIKGSLTGLNVLCRYYEEFKKNRKNDNDFDQVKCDQLETLFGIYDLTIYDVEKINKIESTLTKLEKRKQNDAEFWSEYELWLASDFKEFIVNSCQRYQIEIW